MIILLWQENDLQKVTNIYGMTTEWLRYWDFFWKGNYDIIIMEV